MRVKSREVEFVSKNLLEATRRLKKLSLQGPGKDSDRAYYEVAAWGIYEKRIREIKEWPLNETIISRLVLSTISPVVVYLLKILLGLRITF
jgi:hypothetical protein